MRTQAYTRRFKATILGGASLALLFTAFAVPPSAQAQSYKVLYTFTDGTDGALPRGSLVLDAAGNMYGTTAAGGSVNIYSPTYCNSVPFFGGYGCGVIFKVDPAGNETPLYTFTGGPDGASPPPGVLVRDTSGNLYGTAVGGGDPSCPFGGFPAGCGVVFKLDPAGHETVLYSFAGGADGAFPSGEIVRDAVGNLYGATSNGGNLSGCFEGCGVVFSVDPAGHETVLHAFSGGADGAYPQGDLVRDAQGNIYGSASNGGKYCGNTGGCGVVFEIDRAGKEHVLHDFTGGADGASPQGGLLRTKAGDLYGAASQGGASNAGVLFKLNPAGRLTVLHTFTGTDGGGPNGDLIRDAAGNIYGTTSFGGAYTYAGTVFKLDTAGKETVLYSFTGGADGGNPVDGVTLGAAGDLFGTTAVGGNSGGSCSDFFPAGCGVVFKLSPQ